MDQTDPNEMLGLQAVADMANVTREAVRYWVLQGKLPAPASINDENGNIVRYKIRRADAEAFVAARSAKSYRNQMYGDFIRERDGDA